MTAHNSATSTIAPTAMLRVKRSSPRNPERASATAAGDAAALA
jgi:hypothetical protein